MTDEPPDVRITVDSESDGSESDPYLHEGPRVHTPEHTLVVPVTETLLDGSSGIDVQRFLRTATALAADNDGRVLLFGVEAVGSESALETVREHSRTAQPADDRDAVVETVEKRRRQLAQIADVAHQLDPEVPVHAVVRATTDTTAAILDAGDDSSGTAILLARGTGLDDGWLLARSTVDVVLADAECNVFVENIGSPGGDNALYVPDVSEHVVASLSESDAEPIDSILLAVNDGPHAALATEAARAVASAADASITVLHVVSDEDGPQATSDGYDLLKFTESIIGEDVPVETELREAADETEEILAEATAHDVVTIGAPEEQSRLEGLVFNSIQQTLSTQSEATVLMARDTDRTMRSLYYRWKNGIESADEESESTN
ncbi:Cationic amino acid transporter protein [Halorhabdus tiamatea SARL4B]|uniref:Cationic amino acid transporter protein n=1 Tax=Halorhabdus tiamatea SARL4B TaxID=1033806 RepID=F7PQD8_9EURY|nr:universal stress protein [Halorhabdus tiamatea]ERJ06102.1 Cationic amino acid transporter protein [Halorhabdus tiamatea SARL4B]CCQ33268.1 universal stress protein A (UpsA) domain protein [Halorhabdus tiamatea SARL4B]